MMKKQLFSLVILVAALMLCLSGCASGGEDLEGKYIATFELNGGTLDYGASSVDSKINYAYDPGTYILDPATIDGYRVFRDKYIFTGWYTTPECKPSDKWDFNSKTIDTATLTLYAGWERAIVHSYTIYYMEGEEAIKLGSYNVKAGEKLDDWRGYGNSRKDYTCTGYYSDSACTQPWDFNTAHPGGETDNDIAVYVKHIPGEWNIVQTYDQLVDAIKNGNVYLTADIDCGGKTLFFSGTFSGIFEGNGHTVSNFTVPKHGSEVRPSASLFQTLGANAEIKNVSFTGVTYQFFDIHSLANTVKVAALAGAADNSVKITNVTISGSFQTNYTSELPRLQEAIYDAESTATVTDFTATITVDQQS